MTTGKMAGEAAEVEGSTRIGPTIGAPTTEEVSTTQGDATTTIETMIAMIETMIEPSE